MDNLEEFLNTIKSNTSYKFDKKVVTKFFNNLELSLEENKNVISDAITLDFNKCNFKSDITKLKDIINEFKNKDFILSKSNATSIVNGIGNIGVIYNGSPYITLILALEAIRTHNNIIFFLEDTMLALNSILIRIISDSLKEVSYGSYNCVCMQNNISKTEIIKNQFFFDRFIFIGNKIEFLKFSRKLNVPTIYNGYGEIHIYCDDQFFKKDLLEIDSYAYNNNISLNYFTDESLETSIRKINEFGPIETFVIYTRNTDKAFNFISKVSAKKVYFNTSPFKNYDFSFDEKDLIYEKKVFMKK